MAHNLVTLPTDERERITLLTIVRRDIAPWLLAAGIAMGLWFAVALVTRSANPNMSPDDADAVLFTTGRTFIWAVIVLAVFIARRSRDTWTWALIVLLILLFIDARSFSLTTTALPNSPLYALTAMIGLLAFGRLVEYIHMRYVVTLSEPTLTSPAIIGYCTLIIATIIFNTPFVYLLIQQVLS